MINYEHCASCGFDMSKWDIAADNNFNTLSAARRVGKCLSCLYDSDTTKSKSLYMILYEELQKILAPKL